MQQYLYVVKNGQFELAGFNYRNLPMSEIVIIANDLEQAKLLYFKYKAGDIKTRIIEFGYDVQQRGALFEVIMEESARLPKNIRLVSQETLDVNIKGSNLINEMTSR
ncbi:MAG: hypothetical protein HWD59_09385 [Coxiellaceae bacterium]|nr:MAG: hypothetical protein HWD59_09385 [Coxiellaceae bacterium]